MADTTLSFDILARDRASATFGKVGRSADGMSGAFGSADGRGAKLAGTLGRVAKAGALVAAAGAVMAVKFGIDAVGAASDLSETLNKSQIIFGKNAGAIEKWSETSDKAFGLSQQAALASAASFGDMFSQIGFTGDQAAKMSKSTIQLAADLGSFNNLETEDVLDRISAALRGEYDSLQAVIPNINAARVQTEALAMTGKDNAEQLTAQDKAAAALAIVTKDGARATGDFARTSDGLANQQKILGASFDNAKAKLGKGLMPIMLDVVGWLNKEGVPAFDRFATWFNKTGAPAIGNFIDDVRPLAKEALPALKGALGDVKEILSDAAPLVKDFVEAFNSLPDGVKKTIAAGALVGGIASKLPGKGALGGAVGGALGAAKPIPVFVTNPGFGGKGGGLPGGVKGAAAGVTAATLGGTAAVLTAASAISFAFTAGLMKVSEKVAPKATEKGIWGTPGGSSGFGAGHSFDLSEDMEKTLRATEALTNLLPSAIDLVSDTAAAAIASGNALAEAGISAGQYARMLDSLPPDVRTEVLTPGAVDSRGEVMALKRQFDLTPKQVKTLMKLMGVNEAAAGADKVTGKLHGVGDAATGVGVRVKDTGDKADFMNKVFGKTPGKVTTDITTPGLLGALTGSKQLFDNINRIPNRKDISIVTTYYEKRNNAVKDSLGLPNSGGSSGGGTGLMADRSATTPDGGLSTDLLAQAVGLLAKIEQGQRAGVVIPDAGRSAYLLTGGI